MKRVSTIKIVRASLFMAMTMVATLFIRIPIPLGYVNLGDAFVLLSAFILGPVYGVIAAGVGSALADLVGYASYAPGTLIIKALMAFVACVVYIALAKTTKKPLIAEIVASVTGAVVMTAGYFIYESLLFVTPAVAWANCAYNILQGLVGAAIAVSTMRVLCATRLLEKINKE